MVGLSPVGKTPLGDMSQGVSRTPNPMHTPPSADEAFLVRTIAPPTEFTDSSERACAQSPLAAEPSLPLAELDVARPLPNAYNDENTPSSGIVSALCAEPAPVCKSHAGTACERILSMSVYCSSPEASVSLAARSAPYRLLPPPSRCGFSTHSSGFAMAAFTAQSLSAWDGSNWRANTVAHCSASSRERKRVSTAVSENTCCTFLVPAKCAKSEGAFTALDNSMSFRFSQSTSFLKCSGQ
mmetsp:Transcript_98107/g.299972  ORF Transcript_98107/g.299972 Transcript_98107/m.299972 type:complete len:240 (-) Transcript_98107:1168-1887(-)